MPPSTPGDALRDRGQQPAPKLSEVSDKIPIDFHGLWISSKMCPRDVGQNGPLVAI